MPLEKVMVCPSADVNVPLGPPGGTNVPPVGELSNSALKAVDIAVAIVRLVL